MALQGELMSFLVFSQADHRMFGCLDTCVIFAWSLIVVQPIHCMHFADAV